MVAKLATAPAMATGWSCEVELRGGATGQPAALTAWSSSFKKSITTVKPCRRAAEHVEDCRFAPRFRHPDLQRDIDPAAALPLQAGIGTEYWSTSRVLLRAWLCPGSKIDSSTLTTLTTKTAAAYHLWVTFYILTENACMYACIFLLQTS